MINNVVLVGRLTKDPDLKYTSNGTAVVTFTLAVNRNFTSADGTREADFINCVIWRKPAETLANYARKGTLLGVTGRIQTRSYDNQQGQRVYVTEVVADNFQLLESKKADSSQNTQGSGVSNSQTTNNANAQQNRNNVQSDPFSNSSIDIDDSLPF
ncbi:single-stranded DNA-binding protein [Enterococcus gallinarum]|uniref:single-stranded DNA-binding protein n=1 Tax=Enterococcus gallinarum TaxID=1353 RepID=UPI00189AF17A|nr:single-stranded DNA-binding protein [Enterococcus gallinarum]MCD5186257.1 single-stranded DNA-binding protein [Enterococcus gallinarum]